MPPVGHNRRVATTPSLELVGRDDELAFLTDFVRRLGERPGAVLVRGEPGIGKTALWREAIAIAEREGVRVLAARCAEAEMPIPLGTVTDLLDPVFPKIADALAEPQRHVLSAALGLETDGRGRPDRLALPRALVAAFRALAEAAPVLVAVDDVQWLDPASARTLAFAARRTGDAPIGALATLRGGPDERDPLGLADAFEGRFSELALGPLTPDALQRLVRERFDVRIPRSELAAVHAASGGNPMFALEFARAARLHGADWRALPMPSSLQELVGDRIRALPESSRPVLELVAVVERPTLPLVARVLGGVPATEVLLGDAVAAGAIAVGADGVLRFTHPLLGSAVYAEISLHRRRALHLQVAELVDDLEERARHLALATSEPAESVADVVEQAAEAAAERGAPDAAAIFAAEALRLTPKADEPVRIRRTFACAGLLMEAGDLHEARARIEPYLESGVSPEVRAQALLFRGETEHQDRQLMMSCFREAVEVSPDPRVRCQALLRHAHHGGWVSADARIAADAAREAHRIAVELGDEALTATAAAALAYFEGGRGRRADVPGDEDLLAAERLTRMAPWNITPAISVGSRLLWAGHLEEARTVLVHERDELVRRGLLLRLPLLLLLALADVEWRAGRWEAAAGHAAEASEILDDAMPGGAVVVYYARLLLEGSRGRVEEARRLAEEGLRLAELRSDRVNPLRLRWALGHVELSRGDADSAGEALAGLRDDLEASGIAEPGWQPILPDVTEMLVLRGRLDEAEDVLQQLGAQAAALQHRWATPVALRCRALLLLAREQADEAADAAERAAGELEELGFPLDAARAHLVAGMARRRAGQRLLAAEALGCAVEIFTGLGAPIWLDRAEAELRRARPRPRRDRELTNAERRVAGLVVEGRTNREVAAELFVTNATVEAHLTRIYRKLGVRSRTELARAVTEGVVRLEPERG
jgi:DNA-binding CsgD family transcriptional regulator